MLQTPSHRKVFNKYLFHQQRFINDTLTSYNDLVSFRGHLIIGSNFFSLLKLFIWNCTRFINDTLTSDVRVFTYACGPHLIPTVALETMACRTGGHFTIIASRDGERTLMQVIKFNSLHLESFSFFRKRNFFFITFFFYNKKFYFFTPSLSLSSKFTSIQVFV